MNGIMLQGFEWYLPNDGNHYVFLKEKLEYLKNLGITSIWLPPVCKATNDNDVGYGIYDLFDLGEFDQKGSIRTKYGTKDQLKDLIDSAHDIGISIYADVVINHKAGADETERFQAVEVDREDRTKEIGEAREIEAWTKFTFPGRKDKYSSFKWNHYHFSGVDFDQISGNTGIYKIIGDNKGWSWSVEGEKGNFDYLMFADIDHNNEDVKNEIFYWIKWFIEETNVDGLRMDASKHIDANFMFQFIEYINKEVQKEIYKFGEYWVGNHGSLIDYINKTSNNMDLFDVPLHYNFFEASNSFENYDLRKIFDNSILSTNPTIAVTFVDNHDTQEGESLQSWIQPWFRKHAYALILLRDQGYPCVFFGDLFGIGDKSVNKGMGDALTKLLELRRDYAYGVQEEYSNNEHTIGFVRMGDENHPGRMAVVMTNGDKDTLSMFVGEDQKGKIYHDKLNNNDAEITIREDGWGDFYVSPGKVSVWVSKD